MWHFRFRFAGLVILPVWQIWISICCPLQLHKNAQKFTIQLFVYRWHNKSQAISRGRVFTRRNGTMLTHVTPSSFNRITSLFLQKKGEKQMIMCSIDCLSNPISSLPCYERCCPCYEKTRPMVGRVPDGWTSSAAMPSWPVNHVCCWLRKSFPLSPTLAYKNERINSNKHFHFQSSNHDKRT